MNVGRSEYSKARLQTSNCSCAECDKTWLKQKLLLILLVHNLAHESSTFEIGLTQSHQFNYYDLWGLRFAKYASWNQFQFCHYPCGLADWLPKCFKIKTEDPENDTPTVGTSLYSKYMGVFPLGCNHIIFLPPPPCPLWKRVVPSWEWGWCLCRSRLLRETPVTDQCEHNEDGVGLPCSTVPVLGGFRRWVHRIKARRNYP